MALPSPDLRPSRFVRAAANLAPIACAAAVTVLAAQLVFPSDAPTALAIVALTWTAVAAAAAARRLSPKVVTEVRENPATTLVDGESGLGNARQLADVLQREIARSVRYGDRSAIALFEVQVANFQPLTADELPPSPARFVARTLTNALRDSDAVMRLDRTHFVAVLTECDADGGELLIARLRTLLSTKPYARNHDGSGIYARAWAAIAPWDPAYQDPETYIRAALAALDESRGAYSAAESWFSGQFSPVLRQAPPRESGKRTA